MIGNDPVHSRIRQAARNHHHIWHIRAGGINKKLGNVAAAVKFCDRVELVFVQPLLLERAADFFSDPAITSVDQILDIIDRGRD